ncbi:cytochrome P450 [Mycobacterium intracellulare]|uniref:cytochrome P450 n=1 Tax=Mycobacterium intracellulare TaxID=1767 RepID=UPI00080B14E1|nr:cytochrome P450 [Mycobacterium intracellulare]OCB11749.1 cytochrome [Mycobacterium intracellulare subsp. yongonense]
MTQEQDLSGLGLLAAPELTRNPQPTYKMLRDSAPVMRVDGIGVLVSTRELVDEVLHNPRLYSSALTSGILKNERPLIPLQIDPPEHGKFRKILDPLFAPKRMQALEASIAALVNQLIDGFSGREEIDFVKEFSVPFPTQVFLTMLGLPLDQLPTLLTMKDGIIRPHELVGKPLGHPDTDAYQAATAQSIYTYFTATIEQRKRKRREDMLSWFLEAEIDGDRLTSDEILDICFLFLIAGLDTVSASLDCFFSYLAQHPDARKVIAGDRESIPFIVEELLRWETPVMAVAREAKRDTKLGGCPIHAGEQVLVMLGSANTDEKTITEPESVRFDRKVNRHFGFGGGIHRCLGSHLARVELRTALRVWHERIAEYHIKPGVELDFTPGVRAAQTFPMVLRTGVE